MKSHPYQPLDEVEYLTLEARSPVRHEYIAGEIFAMTGASVRHNVIALNLASALRNHLRGTPCRALMEGVKLRLRKERSIFYPDAMVTCEARLLELDAELSTPKSRADAILRRHLLPPDLCGFTPPLTAAANAAK